MRPGAALGEVARAAGIGRTTLHKQYPTRDDLLLAVAHRALDQLHAAVDGATPPPGTSDPATITAALERLVTDFVPLGPELVFLLRQPSLDDAAELWARFDALQAPIIDLVHQGQRIGLLRGDFPDPWFVSTMYAQTYVAWEGVAAGWLAPLDAPGLVQRTLLEGICGDACG